MNNLVRSISVSLVKNNNKKNIIIMTFSFYLKSIYKWINRKTLAHFSSQPIDALSYKSGENKRTLNSFILFDSGRYMYSTSTNSNWNNYWGINALGQFVIYHKQTRSIFSS